MQQLIVEIGTDGLYVAKNRGFLTAQKGKEEVARLPLDDIAAVVANAHGLTYSNNILAELAGRSIPMVICGTNHMPAAILWPVGTHSAEGSRARQQAAMSLPRQKQVWKTIVQAKLRWQAYVLARYGNPSEPLASLVSRVRSGDPTNVEAQGARRYWTLLFGKSFRRDRAAPGINGLLNYGYTVLRATVARALLSAGLQPAFGLAHKNRSNPLGLVDDLIEPFRALVDVKVYELVQCGVTEITPNTKSDLVGVMHEPVPGQGTAPTTTTLYRFADAYRSVVKGSKKKLRVPIPPRLDASEGTENETESIEQSEWLSTDVDARYV